MWPLWLEGLVAAFGRQVEKADPSSFWILWALENP